MPVLTLLTALNLWTFACFRRDKVRARTGGRRVPERDLLLLALLGGSPAAFAARHMLRHKTVKQPFSRRLKGIAAVQVAGAVLLWWFW